MYILIYVNLPYLVKLGNAVQKEVPFIRRSTNLWFAKHLHFFLVGVVYNFPTPKTLAHQTLLLQLPI